MSVATTYRRMPLYFAAPAALIVSAGLAVLSDLILMVIISTTHVTDDLGKGFFIVFVVSPSLALFTFVCCFSSAMHWHHHASWQAPTLAFALGVTVLLLWGHDWLGFNRLGLIAFLPGGVAWLVNSWLLNRKHLPSKHVLQT